MGDQEGQGTRIEAQEEQITQLKARIEELEAGSRYFTDMDYYKIFRKRK